MVPATVTFPVALIVRKLEVVFGPSVVKVVPAETLMVVKLKVDLVAVAIVQVEVPDVQVSPVPLQPPAPEPKDRSSVPSAPVPPSKGGVARATELSMEAVVKLLVLVVKVPILPVEELTEV